MKMFLRKAPVMSLLAFFLILNILSPVFAFGSLKEKIQNEVDSNPFLQKQQIKLKVVEEQNGYVTIQIAEGDRALRKAIIYLARS